MPDERLPAEQRAALEKQMALLIERAGWETFVQAPLIEPSGDSFPDAWRPDAHGVATVARRLLAYAGITKSRVRVADYSAIAEDRSVDTPQAHFTGVAADKTVELEFHVMGDEVDMVGVLCHEVAAAWLAVTRVGFGPDDPFRGVAQVEAPDDEMAEARASVASVYLGFGIPATNAAHSPRHGGYIEGNMAVTEWAITMAGGLSVGAMVYLLAVQLAVRGRDDETRLALKHLYSNQRAEIETWLALLEGKSDSLRESLGLPARNTWPKPTPLDPQPLAPGGVEVVVAIDSDEVRQFNRGRRVFRVRNRRTALGTVLGTVGGFGVGLAGMGLGLPDLSVLGFVGGGALAGMVTGFRSYFWECSDAQCTHAIRPQDESCSYCGGEIAGELLNAKYRLEAEEELDEEALDEEE